MHLVFGHTGFVGGHVLQELTRRGVGVQGLARNNGCDLRDGEQVERHLRALSPAVIINCAAHVGGLGYIRSHAAEVIGDNTRMIVSMYSAIARACPGALVVNPIPNCTYPGEADIQEEEHWLDGAVHESVIPFASARRLIPAVAYAYSTQYGVRSVNWIMPNAYGPGDSTDTERVHALNGIILRMLAAQGAGDSTFGIWGSGKPKREWIYGPDAARVLVASALGEGPSEQVEPVNIGQEASYSVTEIAEFAATAIGFHGSFTYDLSRPDGAMVKQLAGGKFRAIFPRFRFTPMSEGIAATVAYYQKVQSRSHGQSVAAGRHD